MLLVSRGGARIFCRGRISHPKISRPVRKRKIILKNVKVKNFAEWAQLSSDWPRPTTGAVTNGKLFNCGHVKGIISF